MKLVGVVRSGKGDFAYWLDKLESHCARKTGLRMFPGTLNVHLTDAQYPTPQDCVRLEKEEYGGTVSVSIVPCRIFGRQAFILRPDGDDGKHGDPPEAILEIATDLNLRETFDLQDGDTVTIELLG